MWVGHSDIGLISPECSGDGGSGDLTPKEVFTDFQKDVNTFQADNVSYDQQLTSIIDQLISFQDKVSYKNMQHAEVNAELNTDMVAEIVCSVPTGISAQLCDYPVVRDRGCPTTTGVFISNDPVNCSTFGPDGEPVE